MKKCALYLFVTICFLRAAHLPEEKQHPHLVTEAPISSVISRLNDPAIDAATLRRFWSMSDLTPCLRAPVGEAVRRKIAEPNVDPAILQLARDMGKFYADYPGLREEVATILRSRLKEPHINLAILQVALSTQGFDPELYNQAANIVRRNITGPNTHLGILKLALDISTFDPVLRKDVVAIIGSKLAEANTDPDALELAWYSRDSKLCEKVETIVRSLFMGGKQATDPVILHLGRQMGIQMGILKS